MVSVPLQGFGNRLRSLASAHVYAEHFGCTLHLRWHVTADMPHAWEELFSSWLPPPPSHVNEFSLAQATDHAHACIETFDPYVSGVVVFRGADAFKLQSE